jgi:hypothetical protein
MAFVEDFTVFFTDFGVAATPDAGEPITVIFDRAHIEALGGGISGTQPVALVVSADASSLAPNSSTLEIAGTTYRVLDKQPDGTGLSLLVLEEA